MTWTYNSSSPGSSDRSWVRMRIGDTSSGNQLLQDEEIDALLDNDGNKYLAAAIAAETVGAGFARKVDKTVGRLRIAMQQASGSYFETAKRLRAEASLYAGTYAGGIDVSDKQVDESDTDRVAPAFETGLHDWDSANTTS